MHTQNVNIKTAAQESSRKMGLKPVPVIYLEQKTDAMVELAKIEGELMMYRFMARMDIAPDVDQDKDEVFYMAPFYAGQSVADCAEKGMITCASTYEMVRSIESLAKELNKALWYQGHPGELWPLSVYQKTAVTKKKRSVETIALNQKPFSVEADGRVEYPQDDPRYGTYFSDGTITLGRAWTIAEAMEIAASAWLDASWNPREAGRDYYDSELGRDMGPVSFSAQNILIRDEKNRLVLGGDAMSLQWFPHVSDREEIASNKAEVDCLMAEGARESGWDNFDTARGLWAKAARLELKIVDPVWRGHPDVMAALAGFVHPDLEQQAMEDFLESNDEIEF